MAGAVPVSELAGERRRVAEVEHEGAAGREADGEPGEVRHALLEELDRTPAALVERDARVAVALPEALDHDHQIGPHRLRAGVAAPDAAGDGGDEEQRQRRQHQQAGDEVELLRPDLEEEEEEAVVGHVEQHGLVGQVGPAIPAQPGQRVVDAERDRHHQPLDARGSGHARAWDRPSARPA